MKQHTPETFWGRINRRNAAECWPWSGALTRYRDNLVYGVLSYKGKKQRAHRVAWILTHGPIPHGIFVCHRCDNPICCNPDHLFLGTNYDNSMDRDLKGRTSIGEAHGSARLTEKQAIEILARPETSWALAPRYGVHRTTIEKLRSGKTWKYLTSDLGMEG